MTRGNIILLNGTSSAGKSTIAKALQDVMEAPYLHTGVDHFLERIPPRLIVTNEGVDLADGWLATFRDHRLVGIKIGPVGYHILAGMYHAIAALSEQASTPS